LALKARPPFSATPFLLPAKIWGKDFFAAITAANSLARRIKKCYNPHEVRLASCGLNPSVMKAEIHPTYFPEAKVVCACGNKFTIGSTKPEIHAEVCSNCHPFYTGEAKFVDTEGRVERFERIVKAKQEAKPKKEEKVKERERPRTLKEMLERLEKS